MASPGVAGGRRRGLGARWALAALMLISACGGGPHGHAGNGREVVVMAAASLIDAVEAVDGHFDGSPGIVAVVAGSSTLLAQLAAGADADVLITADAATMDRAAAEGLVRGAPVVIAANALVLATAADNPGHVTGLGDLARGDLLVGLCAVEVPCGALAQRALEGAGVAASVDTLEPNVRALAAKLSLGELDAGLVYRTDAAMAGLATVDAPELHSHTNRYYIASVSADPRPEVLAVIDGFTEPGGAGAEALLTYGFGPP